MSNYEKIIKDCFWDYDIDESDLKKIISNANDSLLKGKGEMDINIKAYR